MVVCPLQSRGQPRRGIIFAKIFPPCCRRLGYSPAYCPSSGCWGSPGVVAVGKGLHLLLVVVVLAVVATFFTRPRAVWQRPSPRVPGRGVVADRPRLEPRSPPRTAWGQAW